MSNEIDLAKIVRKLLDFWWLLVIALIAGAVTGYMYTIKFKSDTYTSTTRLIISTQQSSTVTTSTISASEMIIQTCIQILNSDAVVESDIIESTGLDYTVDQIKGMTSMSAVNETQVFSIQVTASNPTDAYTITSAYENFASQTIVDKLPGVTISHLDPARFPSNPDGKGATKSALILGLLFALAVAGVISLICTFETKIHSEADLEAIANGVPIIGVIPSFESIKNISGEKSGG